MPRSRKTVAGAATAVYPSIFLKEKQNKNKKEKNKKLKKEANKNKKNLLA